MWLWFLSVFFGGFIVGALVIVAAEAFGVLFVINRLNKRSSAANSEASDHLLSRDLDAQQSLDFAYNKQGVVWVLESEKVPKEVKRKKEFIEVSPLRKYAKIKDGSLILRDSVSDNSRSCIRLKGCIVEAVSATSLPSRKWAKRFPIKIESKSSNIYNGSKTVYLYLETSWEKESWCKALRLASCEDKGKLEWFMKLSEKFHVYLTSLNTGYPSFMKPLAGFHAEPLDRDSKLDGSSKVRLFWKKLARKASKHGVDNKGIWTSVSGREDKRLNEKFRQPQDSVLANGTVKSASTVKPPASLTEENMTLPSESTFSRSGSQSHTSVISDADSDEKFNFDEGTLCWNLLISRIFFDAKSNSEMKSSIQARIQRTLSSMRTPSYIGEVICTHVDPGNLPPYIHGMRVLPVDMNEVWSLEVDIEYCGGVLLDIETRLEVRELDLQKGLVNVNSEQSSVEDVSSDLLEGFEYFGKQLNISEGTVDTKQLKDDGDSKIDDSKSSKGTQSAPTNVSRWKSIVNSVAKQVSQVPLSLSVRVASLRGTMRLHIKPPPSDQLWFGFTSMPDIEFELESSVGEHKITSGHLALFLISRFKAAIRETMVLPNCESVCIPWMLAEKDDWIPRKAAPFIWLNQEAVSDTINTVSEGLIVQPSEAKGKTVTEAGSSDLLENKSQKPKNAESESSTSVKPLMQSSKSMQELKAPLLEDGEQAQEILQRNTEETPENLSLSRSLVQSVEDDDLKPKKMGKKARMFDLGKKMGEKLEEKRRHIEEKGRHIVERMRGP